MSYPDFYLAWLKDSRYSGSRIALIEVTHGNTVYGLSDYPYLAHSLTYDDLIVEPIEIEESFNSVGVGDIVFLDDKRNFWITESFTGDECKIFLGDKTWRRDKFELIVLSAIQNIERTDNNTYQINFDNTDYRLDENIASHYINDQLIPFALGNPFNCAPILSNYSTQEYQFNQDLVDTIAVRDAGLTPDSVNNDYNGGKITLGKFPMGQITGDISERHQTLVSAIDYLLDKAGVSSNTIDLINFNGQEEYKIGWYSKDLITYRDIITALIEPLGLSMRRNNLGEHQLISANKSASILTLDVDDLFAISMAGFEAQKNTIELGYAKNFEVQSQGSLVLVSADGLTEENKTKYGLEYKTLSKSINNAAIGKDNLIRIDTYLTDEDQVNQELIRLEEEYNEPKKRWNIEATIAAVVVSLGDTITVKHDDINDDVVVIGFKKDLSGQQIDLEVIQ